MVLSAREKREFEQNGFLLLDGAVDDRLVSAARQTVRSSLDVDFDDPAALQDSESPGQLASDLGGKYVLGDVLPSAAPMKEIVRQAVPYAEELVGDRLVTDLNATMSDDVLHNRGLNPIVKYPAAGVDWRDPNCVGENAPYAGPNGHLDGYAGEDKQRPWTIGVTVLLDRVQPRGGGTVVWPGSHRIVQDRVREHSLQDFQGGPPEDMEFGRPFEVAGPPGTLMLWHNKLLHGSVDNHSPNVRMMGFARLCRDDVLDIYEDAAENIWKYWDGIDGDAV
jgi:hypothetical protein